MVSTNKRVTEGGGGGGGGEPRHREREVNDTMLTYVSKTQASNVSGRTVE